MLVDSRTVEEYEKGTIPGAINYPLDDLRKHVDFIKSQDKKVIVFCQKGLRGYLAELILKNNGVTNSVNVAGGFKIWQMYSDHIEIPEPMLVKQ
jgi:rhodanese-related sulfurtransferase